MYHIISHNKQDYAHPDICPLIHAYPEQTKHEVSEVWHARKWLIDAPDHLLTPMVRCNGKDFYINELVYCNDHTWFIPTRFYDFDHERWALGHEVVDTAVSSLSYSSKTLT